VKQVVSVARGTVRRRDHNRVDVEFEPPSLPGSVPVHGRGRLTDSLPFSLAQAPFRRVESGCHALGRGRPIVLVDDVHGDDEGMLVAAAEGVSTQVVAFLVRHTSGFLCVALPENDCDRLDLPPLLPSPGAEALRDAFCVTVDAATGIGTGISASDRARTIRALANSTANPTDFSRPGHVVPTRAHEGGVLARPGRAEAASDLARLAVRQPISVFAQLISVESPVDVASDADARAFSNRHGLAIVWVSDLVAYRLDRL
jgi:3,4-dihydroxy 2-butanone 4-phosphate synthase / GTP cyclohydrolase II